MKEELEPIVKELFIIDTYSEKCAEEIEMLYNSPLPININLAVKRAVYTYFSLMLKELSQLKREIMFNTMVKITERELQK